MMSDKAGKQETLEKISSLELRILALERDRKMHLYSKRHEHRSLYCVLEEHDIKLCAERKVEKQELQHEISRIRSNVDAFRRMLLEMKPDPEFVEKLKQTMEGVESFIVAFKDRQRDVFEALLLEEQTAVQEMTAFERKLESWAAIPRAQHLKTDKGGGGGEGERGPGSLPPSSMPLAVLAFERFLQQTGGREGGWDDYDHQTFLKIRSNFNIGNRAFLDAVAKELPTKSPEEILEHERWCVEFNTLLDSKRRAIETWREERQKKKPSDVAKTLHIAERPLAKEELFEKERRARFSKLEAWKAEQKSRQEEALKKRLEMERKNARLKERENNRRVMLKKKVDEYVSSREAQFEEQRTREEAKKAQELAEKRIASRELEEKFRERDMKVIMDRRKKEELKEMEKIEKEKQLHLLKEQVSVRAERDPSRLYKLTKGWEERKKATRDTSGVANISLPRRAVPSWRQRV